MLKFGRSGFIFKKFEKVIHNSTPKFAFSPQFDKKRTFVDKKIGTCFPQSDFFCGKIFLRPKSIDKQGTSDYNISVS